MKTGFDKRYMEPELRNDTTLLSLHKRYGKKCEAIEYGRNRATYIFKNYVVKIPISFDGFVDNDWEGSVKADVYARTRLAYYKDIPVVFMETIIYADNKTIKNILSFVPDWVYSIDCGQVGFNRKNELLAFDFGVR